MNMDTGISPPVDRQAGHGHTVPRAARPGQPGSLPRGELVGRDAELRALAEFVRQATPHGAVRVLSGQAGAGRSALLEAAVSAAIAAGVRVLRCSGVRGAVPVALSGLRQILWPLLDTRARSLTGSPSDVLEMLLADAVPAAGGRSRLAFGVLEMLEEAAREHPVLLAVDDWDALDEASREALSFIARRIEGHPIALLLTARPHRTRLAPLDGLRELPLAPLGPTDSARLLAVRRPGLDPQSVRDLLAAAAGNPLALLELPADGEDDVPYVPASSNQLAASMAPGIRRLPDGTRSLLLVAALHPAGDLPLLLSAASRVRGSALGFAVLEAAETEGLVTYDGMRLVFDHPATAGAVVHGTDQGRVRAAHAALAAVLQPGSMRTLWHRSQAVQGTDQELARRLEAVYGEALAQHESALAVRMLRRAAELYATPRDRGRCTVRAAQVAQSLGLDRMARTLGHRAGRWPLGPLGVLCARELAHIGTGRPPADPAGWPLPCGPDEVENALELVRITAPAFADGAPGKDAFVAFLDKLPAEVNEPRLLQAMVMVAPVRRAATIIAGVHAERRETALSVRDLGRLGEAALSAGDPQRALNLYRRIECRHHFYEEFGQLPPALLRQGLAQLALGDWAQSDHTFRRCADVATAQGQDEHTAAARLLTGLVRSLRTGRPVRHGDEQERAAARRAFRPIELVLDTGTACARAEAGDFRGAFLSLRDVLTGPEPGTGALYALVAFAEAAGAVNASAQAIEVLDRLEKRLGDQAAPEIRVRFVVARAVLADGPGEEALFERALAEDLSARPFLAAPLYLAHGRRLRHRRRFLEARASLRQAAATYTLMGAEARSVRVAAELRASGERLETGSAGGPGRRQARDLLSAQELRVAELAGQGLSNREIGALLNLSPRTIGAYLYRIFPRLGVTARAQLAQALREGVAV
ncbi:AAA family ATPase [Streptomyces longispororuber]|uniref:AAA family ATPase n=1 Tax=Streptomyces longispororuber TaxID=68230 RepID=UPI00210B0DCD|nr:LuxR family transcriptional regulator [Streptomyces longispororuber]MCQ4212942.1 AAA family ATPase [Streptomyces longispororuber]